MDGMTILVIIGVLLIIITSFFPKKQHFINKCNNLSNDDLVRSKVSCKWKVNILLVIAFVVIPVVMGAIMPKIAGTQWYNIFLSLSIFAILFSIAICGIFQRFLKIIESDKR